MDFSPFLFNFYPLKMTEYIIRNNTDQDEEDYEYDDEGNIVYYAVRPNKTQIKKEIAVFLALGEEIASLPSMQITALALPEKLENSIREIIKMPHKAARKRQLKFIAQQFYKMDNIDPILEKVAKYTNKSSHAVREHHIVESWRERLLGEHHDDALTDLLNEKPHADRQHLRQLVRNAQKEIVANKPAKSPKLLYRYLKTLFEDDELDDLEEHTLLTDNNEVDDDFDEDEDDFEDDDEYDD